MEQKPPQYTAEKISLNKRRELPIVWILPIIALLVTGWLIFKAVQEKGPVITIRFPTAEGLEVDKTKVRFLNVEIGKVTAITIEDDMKTIQVTAQLSHSASRYLREHTKFWVVRPQIGLGGVSGLGTLLSGPYIELQPGEGSEARHFDGLATPPVLKPNQDGRAFVLETRELGSLRAGTPINFHGIQVGEVLSYQLMPGGAVIRLSVFINAPYHHFVREHTRFWKDGGIDLTAGADGFKFRTAPLVSLLSGGIAFEVSNEDDASAISSSNKVYKLFNDYAQTTQMVYQNALLYEMHFKGSVRGLTESAPVQIRGITIGRVKSINLEVNARSADISIPVLVELELERLKQVSGAAEVDDHQLVANLVKKGLRAQLQTGSLLTGQLLVDLDFYPESKPMDIVKTGKYPEFPTTASSLDQFSTSAKVIMDKLAKLPLHELTQELNKTLQVLQKTSVAATTTLQTGATALQTVDKTVNAAGKTLGKVDNTLQAATQTFGTANHALSHTLSQVDNTLNAAQQSFSVLKPGSDTHYQLQLLLQELTQAASSVRQLSDYMGEHPDALLRGKKEP